MSEQLSIFSACLPGSSSDPPRARRDDPATSQLAAQQAITLAADHYAKIIDALEERNGTIYELATATGLTHVQIARRMPELAAYGKVTATDETRLSPSGRQCRVWKLAR